MPETPPRRAELELRDYLRVLRRRKWALLIPVAVCLALAAIYTVVQARVYEAEARLVLEASVADTILPNSPGPGVITEVDVQTEAELMDSLIIARAVNERLGYAPKVKISTIDETPAVYVTAESTDPEKARRAVNDFTNAYVEVRTEIITETLMRGLDDLETEITNLDISVTEDKARIDEITQALATSPPAGEAALLETERDRLQAQVNPERVVQRQAELQSSIDRLTELAALNARGDYFTVSGSELPTSPIRPEPIKNMLFGLGAGLLIGITAAFLRDYFDDTLRTKEDLDATTGGVPVVGLIPAIEGWSDRDATILEAQVHPHSAASEAYRTLRTSLAFASIERRMLIIQITSSTSGEGKTTTAANLAVTLANTGKQVVLVDCDLRRPRVHDFFGLGNDVGFASVLLGEVNVADALQAVAGVPGLHVLPSGPPPPNPAELLSTVAAKRLLEGMGEVADYVVVDSPPLLPVADSTTLAGYADATILLVTAKATTRRSLNRSLEILDQINAPLEGILFNGVGREATYGYGYGYSYTDDASGAGRKRRTRKLPPADEGSDADPAGEQPVEVD